MLDRRKTAIIDGASAAAMQDAILGRSGRFNWSELRRILSEEIGSLPLAGDPIITTPPVLQPYLKTLRSAGFRVEPVTSINSQDDERIKELIARLTADTTGEIVIVTADQDFVRTLRRKVKEGIKVYWVATRCVAPGKGPSIGVGLEALFAQKEFDFVELAQYHQEIASARSAVPNLVLVLEVPNAPLEGPVIATIARLTQQYPGLMYRIEQAHNAV